MKQKFNLSAWLYYILFKIKGFKTYRNKNQEFVIDSKRTILISSMPSEDILEIYIGNQTIRLPNPHRKGLFKIKGFSPYLCLLIC